MHAMRFISPSKKTSIWMLTFCLCFPLFAKNLPKYNDVRLIRMPYENAGGERGMTTFYYGRDGRLCNTVWNLLDSSRYSINVHLYNDDGLEIEKYREFSDSLTSSEKYEYDGKGRRIKETFSRSDGIGGTGVFHWDAQNRMIAMDCDKYKSWLTARIEYEYDGQRCISAKILRGDESLGDIVYEYDQAGHRVKEHWDFSGQWSQTFTFEYEPMPLKVLGFSSPYVSMNARYRVVAEDYDFNGETGGPSSYKYDEGGKLIEKIFQRADGLKTVTAYQYDETGNLKTSHRKFKSGQATVFSYKFDSARRLTERSFTRSDGASGYEKYHYNKLGCLEKAEYKNMDTWLNGVISFKHDGWGRLKTGYFQGEDGFDANLIFKTDVHGNVLRMHWKFTFGKTQTYTFEYAPIQE